MKRKLGAVIKQVQGLRVRILLDEKKCQIGFGICSGKVILQKYPNDAKARAIADAKEWVKGTTFKKNIIHKLKSQTL